MNKLHSRHYLMIAMTGMFCWLTTGVVSAHVGSTKTGWSDLAPEVRAEIAALKATVAALQAGQVSTTKTGWNDLANDVQNWLTIHGHNFDILNTQVNLNTSSIATNASDIDGVEASDVPGLGTYLRIGEHNSKPAVIFEDANVLVLNGTGSTSGDTNGVGNLIVGYDEDEVDGSDDKTGSHNLVVGRRHTYSSYGGLVAGGNNNVTGEYASVSGGWTNTASGNYSSVSGGRDNTAGGVAGENYSSVSGGYGNTASGWASSVSGGLDNTASEYYSSVSGGQSRTASGSYDWAAGSLSEDY